MTADGTLHEVDCLIYATGFQTTDFMLPMRVLERMGAACARAGPGAPTPTSG